MKVLYLLLTILCCVSSVRAQDITVDTLLSRMARQVYDYPQEKVHVMTDKPSYYGGDTIRFRAFVADASTHRPLHISKYLYVELINPYDHADLRVKVMERGGVYEGYLPLDPMFAEGDYSLVAYTAFMENAGENYFFRKRLSVRSPFSMQGRMECGFEWKGDDLNVTVGYKDGDSGEYLVCEDMGYLPYGGLERKRKNWRAEMDFRLGGKSLEKHYVLVSFGNYSKYIRLPQRDGGGFDVTFHPEGGYLVPGAECRVAFKAIGSDGLGTDVSGRVFDSGGSEVSRFSSVHLGMGVFSFTPLAGERYTAEVRTSSGVTDVFPLPDSYSRAGVLHVLNAPDTLFVSSAGVVPPGSFVLLQQRGNVLAVAPIGNDSPQYFEKRTFPAGVTQILLLDGHGNTLSERLVFIRDSGSRVTSISSDSTSYGNREKVCLDISLEGYSARSGSIAVSVTDDELVGDKEHLPIEAQMLLQSDIVGTIEAPAYYFGQADDETDLALDVLLMTQGWRRYDIPNVLLGRLSEATRPLEIGQEISGKVRRIIVNTPREGVNVSVMSAQNGYANLSVSDKDGLFTFSGFDFPEGTNYVVQALDKDGSPVINFDVFEEKFPANVFGIPSSVPQARIKEYTSEEKMMINSNEAIKEILLDEIVILGRKKVKQPKDIYQMLANKSFDADYLVKNNITSFDEIVYNIAGMREVQGYLQYRNSFVTYMIDGVLQEGFFDMTIPFSEIKLRFNFDMIDRVDFIPSYMSACFGVQDGGILSIKTKNIGAMPDRKLPLNMRICSPLGYQKPVEFYSPKYDASDNLPTGTDLRSTVHWAPAVQVGADGKAHVEFYTSDMLDTSYTVRVEGLSDEGEIISGSYDIPVKNRFMR